MREAETLEKGEICDDDRIRAVGGGRPSAVQKCPALPDAVLRIVENRTYGNPDQVLSWTTLSLRKICAQLEENDGIKADPKVASRILKDLGYSRQCKYLQNGVPHEQRDEQFRFIESSVNEFLAAGDPVVSLDAKKKELLGNFANNGTEYRLQKDPRLVADHDFLDRKLGQVQLYGVYSLNDNTAFINLGTDHDTAEFAVNSLWLWWEHLGKCKYPNARRLLL